MEFWTMTYSVGLADVFRKAKSPWMARKDEGISPSFSTWSLKRMWEGISWFKTGHEEDLVRILSISFDALISGLSACL